MKFVRLILIAALSLIFGAGCNKKPYSTTELINVEIVGSQLLLFVDHELGFEKYRHPMAHQSGVTVTQHNFILLTYDVTERHNPLTKLAPQNARLLFTDKELKNRYEFRPFGDGKFQAVRILTSGEIDLTTYVDFVGTHKTHVLKGRERVAGQAPLIWSRRNSDFVYNQSPLIVNSLVNSNWTNAAQFSEWSSNSKLPNCGDSRRAVLTEDLHHLILLGARVQDKAVSILDTKGAWKTITLNIPDSQTLIDAELQNNELVCLVQGLENTAISKADNSFSRIYPLACPVNWYPQVSKILFKPLGFGAFDNIALERPLVVWNYEINETNRFTLDFVSFQSALVNAMR